MPSKSQSDQRTGLRPSSESPTRQYEGADLVAGHAARFDQMARSYSTDRYPGRGLCMQRVLALLDPAPRDIVLDVGCGPGTQLLGLAHVIAEGYGVDPSGEMIQRATEEAAGVRNLHFHVGSAQQIPGEIKRAGVHKIMSNYALHHLPDSAKRAAIINLAEMLPIGGVFVLGDLMFSEDPRLHEELFEVVGYGPGNDDPAEVAALEEMFAFAGLSTTTYLLNPLAGVIVGRREDHRL